jgi:CelD/BcsL family acetyltransferase involved in cellulose biosynthesis
MTVCVEVVSTLEEAESLVPAWEELAAACGARGTAAPAYCLAWWRHRGNGRLLVLAAFDGGALVGLAPLHERRLGLVQVVRLLGHGLGTVGEVLLAPGREDVAEAVWASLARSRRRLLQLVEYRQGAGGLPALRRSGDWDARIAVRESCPVAILDRPLDELLASPARRRLRRTLSKADRALAEADLTHEVEVIATWDRLQAAMDDLQAVFDAAEREKARLHFFDAEWRGFTLDLLRQEADAGRLAVFMGRIGGRPVSVALTLRSGATLGYWAPRFDPSFARFTPGHLLLRGIAEHVLAEPGLRELDLLLGEHDYKLQWSTASYDTLGVTAARSGMLPLGSGLLAGLEQAHRLRGRLRR